MAAAAGGEWTLGRPGSRGQFCDVTDSGGGGPGSVACRPAADPATQHTAHSTRTIFLFLGGFSLTFVFVGLGLDAEDGDHHDDDDDGGRGQRHHEPDLAVEGLGLEVAELEVHLGRRLDLGNNGNV